MYRTKGKCYYPYACNATIVARNVYSDICFKWPERKCKIEINAFLSQWLDKALYKIEANYLFSHNYETMFSKSSLPSLSCYCWELAVMQIPVWKVFLYIALTCTEMIVTMNAGGSNVKCWLTWFSHLVAWRCSVYTWAVKEKPLIIKSLFSTGPLMFICKTDNCQGLKFYLWPHCKFIY